MVKHKGDKMKYCKDRYLLEILNNGDVIYSKKYDRLKDMTGDLNCCYGTVKNIFGNKIVYKNKWKHIRITKLETTKLFRDTNMRINRPIKC